MKKNWKYSLLLITIVFAVAMGIFFLFYRFDNKYTAKGDQAIQGILYVPDDDTVHYLAREWEYYPDVLLTPQELKKHKDEYYSRYVSIGEYGGMDMGDKNRSPFGSGTYRMTLVLPEREKRYAIGLVEVFSAYKLYINGNLIGQVGDPDPDNYLEQIQNRVFTFEGKKTVEIMIAVTDKHSVSSGIQYVPVLSSPFKVNIIRGLSIVIDAVYMALTFFVLVFSVYMFVRTGKTEIGFFCLLCICVLGYSSYPILHTFVAVKVQPCYGLEALFYYLMFACVVLVQQKILGDERRLPEILAGVIAAAGVLIFVVELLGSRAQSADGLYLISWITEILKWAAAGYLLFRSVKEIKQKYSNVLLVGIVVYAASLAADRIWKLYEPIIGGWFMELGSAVLVFSVGLTLWMELANAYRFHLTYGEYSRQMEQKLQMQKQHYEELTAKMDEISRMRHDMRHHMRALMSYAQQGKYQELMKYLQEYASVMTEEEKVVCYCRNMAVDAVIHFYAGELRQRGISFEYDMMLPQNIGITDTDLCKIYGNLLENAVDAVKELSPESHPYVKVLTKIKNKKLLIEISNPYSNEIQRKENGFYSTKHEGFGIGTASVTEVVQRIGGYVAFSTEEGIFKVNIFLPAKIV
nr:GHKL domain-containing protein [uncultured Blautia sp.]